MATLNSSNRQYKYEYPLDRDFRFKSRIAFQAIKIIPPRFSTKMSASQTADEATGTERAKEVIGATGISGLKTYPIPGESVSLYVPIAFAVTDTLSYNQANLGTAGALVASGLNAGGGIGEATLGAIKEAGQSIFDFFRGVGGGDISRVAAVRGADLMVGVPDNVKSAIGITARVTMNPNIRTQFQGVVIREFQFQFKFIPKSADESRVVKDIIKFFRFHAYPEEIGNIGSFSMAYDYPNMFKVRLLSESQEGPVDEKGNRIFKNIGTPIKLCYLTSVAATYNSTASVLHSDGSPTEVDLSLSFSEYKTLSRYDVINEDDEVFYNFENQAVGG